MTWKEEIKKYYVGYEREQSEMAHRQEQFQEELEELVKMLIEDLEKVIQQGVTDSRLKKAFKDNGIPKFSFLDFISRD